MPKIFFTGDTHFYHNAIIDYCARPIPGWMNKEERIAEMNKQLISKWNEKISPMDEVYHLGDFAFCGTTKAVEILKQLNGHKYLIRGNHDYGIANKQGIIEHFQWIKDYYVLRVQDIHQNEDEENKFTQYHQPIVLCHYPILSWDGMAHGSWHLHGHCHGSLPPTRMMRKDVGVDTNKMYPYEYMEIKNIMAMKSVVPVDHHGLT